MRVFLERWAFESSQWRRHPHQCACWSVTTFCDPMNCSPPGFPVLHYLPESAQTHIHRVNDVIQSSHSLSPLRLLPSIFPRIRVFSSESALHTRCPKYWSFSFSISPSDEYSGFTSFRINWDWSPCCLRDSQKSSPTPQIKSINSSALSFLYGPILTSVHDYWKSHSFDYTDLCQQSDVSAF